MSLNHRTGAAEFRCLGMKVRAFGSNQTITKYGISKNVLSALRMKDYTEEKFLMLPSQPDCCKNILKKFQASTRFELMTSANNASAVLYKLSYSEHE